MINLSTIPPKENKSTLSLDTLVNRIESENLGKENMYVVALGNRNRMNFSALANCKSEIQGIKGYAHLNHRIYSLSEECLFSELDCLTSSIILTTSSMLGRMSGTFTTHAIAICSICTISSSMF